MPEPIETASQDHGDQDEGAPARISTIEIETPAQQQRKEIVVGEAGGEIVPIIPRTIAELTAYASWVIAAGMVPAGIEVDPNKLDLEQFDGANIQEKRLARFKAADRMTRSRVMIVIEKGLEIGLGPISALSTIMIVNNRPCVWGDGAAALIHQHNKQAKQEIEWKSEALKDDWTCIVRLWRVGNPTPFEGRFVYKTAKSARLLGKKPWQNYPERMMFNRARAFAQRDGFADCIMGLGIREEVEDMPDEPKGPVDTSFLDNGPAAVSGPQNGANGPQAQIEHTPGETVEIKPAVEKVAVTTGRPGATAEPRVEEPVPAAGSATESRPEPPVEPPKLAEPRPPKKKADIAAYSAELIAWAQAATTTATEIQGHIEGNDAATFIRENRSADWDKILEAMDAKR